MRIMNIVIRLNVIFFIIIVLSVAAPYRLDNMTLSITMKNALLSHITLTLSIIMLGVVMLIV